MSFCITKNERGGPPLEDFLQNKKKFSSYDECQELYEHGKFLFERDYYKTAKRNIFNLFLSIISFLFVFMVFLAIFI